MIERTVIVQHIHLYSTLSQHIFPPSPVYKSNHRRFPSAQLTRQFPALSSSQAASLSQQKGTMKTFLLLLFIVATSFVAVSMGEGQSIGKECSSIFACEAGAICAKEKPEKASFQKSVCKWRGTKRAGVSAGRM